MATYVIANLITRWFGLPSSSSHALIGGYAGAAVAKAGMGALILSGWIKTSSSSSCRRSSAWRRASCS